MTVEIELKPLPPAEAIAYFRGKGYAIGFDWRDVWAEEHQVAFTVAKAMSIDLLMDIRGAVDQAIADGITFDAFRKQLEPVLQAKGWWGKQLVTDPKTGETVPAQLGSRRRLDIIYDTNLRTAHAAGGWHRIERTKDLLPWLAYHQIDRPTKRQAHIPFDGLVLPVDDPFWDHYYPPNGWKCKCSVHQYTDGQLDRLGLKPSASPAIDMVPWQNDRTGETVWVAKGIDPGFDQNVGKTDRRAQAVQRLRDKQALIQEPAASPAPQPISLQKRWDSAREEVLRQGTASGTEWMRCYTEDGEDLGLTTDGQRSAVNFTAPQLRAVQTPGRQVVVHHNHPSNRSLSSADVGCLGDFPGLVEVVAHGHQGGMYAARRVDAATGTSLADTYGVASGLVRDELTQQLTWNGGPLAAAQAEALHAHLVVLALHRAGLVEYRYELRGDIATVAWTHRALLRDLVDQVTERLKSDQS